MKLILKRIIIIIILILSLILLVLNYKTNQINEKMSFDLIDIKDFKLITTDLDFTLEEQKVIITKIKKQKFTMINNTICMGVMQKNFIYVTLKNGLEYSIYLDDFTELKNQKYLICINEFPMYINSY